MAESILSVGGIYAIVNKVTGKRYVGSAKNIADRWYAHQMHLNRRTHHSRRMQEAWNKHAFAAFEVVVLEIVIDSNDLLAREQVWMDHFQVYTKGYNMRPGASSWIGIKQTPEHIAKRVQAHLGAIRSQETCEKIRQKAIGRKQSAEQVAKRVAHIIGKKHTAEHIKKASIARIGRKNTPESIAKMKAVIKTPETKAKMSAAHLGKKLSPESIAKRTATFKANRLAKKLAQV